MITDFILTAFWALVWVMTSPFRLLDDVTIDAGVGSAISTAAGYIGNVNLFIPVDTFLTIVGLIVTIELVINGYKVAMWALRRVPGQS